MVSRSFLARGACDVASRGASVPPWRTFQVARTAPQKQRTAASISGLWRPGAAFSSIEILDPSLLMTSLLLLPVALLAGLVAPTPNASTTTQRSSGAGEVKIPSVLDSARVEVVAGRAVLVGAGMTGHEMRRGESKSARGRTHLEVTLGSQVRVWWTETMSIEVFGPSSVEWIAEGDRVRSIFHQLTWADVEVRRGEHEVSIPASWRAALSRGAFRLRGIAGGPSEFFHHAGRPARLEWLGNPSQPIPPVFVYPGSSVRLDRPRHVRSQPALPDGEALGGAWALDPEAESLTSVWPWRGRTDTDADVARRERIRRTTRVLDEPFGASGGRYERIVTPDGLGGSTSHRTAAVAAPAPRGAGGTLSQIPVTPEQAPEFIVTVREDRGASDEAGTVAEPRERWRAGDLEQLPAGGDETSAPDGMGAMPPEADRTDAAQAQRVRPGSRPAVPFDAAQWRGLLRAQLNGTGVMAAERGAGVEVRVLGGGRTKVFVSSGSPAPRWCFTPRSDYLMQPGAVAVFEADGSLRMSFGTLEEHAPRLGRPSFDRLDPR